MARETWPPIPGYSLYDVSSRGRVRSWNGSKAWGRRVRLKKPRLRTLGVRSDGYVQVHLIADDCTKNTVAVHRAVLLVLQSLPAAPVHPAGFANLPSLRTTHVLPPSDAA